MERKAFEHLLSTLEQREEEERGSEDVVSVSETVSAAVSVYETVRNTLEYDEEHLLRRNAIRRILKRRLGELDSKQLSLKLVRELIWARYIPNHRVPMGHVQQVGVVLEKYRTLFLGLSGETSDEHAQYEWLLDVLSTEIEYLLCPPQEDEALAGYAYQVLRARLKWQTPIIEEADQDLQLYIATHRAVVKSNEATLRYRLLTLFYPKWRTATAEDEVVQEVATHFARVYESVEKSLHHPGADALFRFVRRHAIVFRLLTDVAQDNLSALRTTLAAQDVKGLDKALTSAINARYKTFRSRLVRRVFRAALFLLFTKSFLALVVEYPYEVLWLHSTDYVPLLVNILFPPVLLLILGMTVRIPEKQNTAAILQEAHAFLGLGDDVGFLFKQRTPWTKGVLWGIFYGLYLAALFAVGLMISSILHRFHFNGLSIGFFLFFLSLVTYFGIRIRNTRRELMLVETDRRILFIVGDILFLPLIRVGRWVALRAPKVNVFLFFFDFIIEAPFKGVVEVLENWLAFLREKREEI